MEGSSREDPIACLRRGDAVRASRGGRPTARRSDRAGRTGTRAGLSEPPRPQSPAVLLLGTFHFEYPDLDVEKPGQRIDVATHERQLQIESPQERILVIIGSGHVPILRFVIGHSPEYELVEVAGYPSGT